jgi:hypothetical protein
MRKKRKNAGDASKSYLEPDNEEFYLKKEFLFIKDFNCLFLTSSEIKF